MVDWSFRWSSIAIVVLLLYVLIYSVVNAFNYNGFQTDLTNNQPPSMSSGSIQANLILNGITALLALVMIILTFLDH